MQIQRFKTDNCVNWTKAKDSAGYGVSWKSGKWIRAHVKTFLEQKGEIFKGLVVRHICDNKACVNPNHLILGSHKENSNDMVSRNRQAKGEQAGNSKLTEKEVLQIRCSTDSSRKLAKQYNISKTNVLDIKKKKIWRHI